MKLLRLYTSLLDFDVLLSTTFVLSLHCSCRSLKQPFKDRAGCGRYVLLNALTNGSLVPQLSLPSRDSINVCDLFVE